MKNITVAIDDETYRKARIVAAQRDVSVSALVKKFLISIASEAQTQRDLKQEQEALLDSIRQKHPGFTAKENVAREALYDRHGLR